MTGNVRLTRKLIQIFGIESPKTVHPRAVIFTIISIYILIQSILSIAYRWNDITIRYISMEDFNDSLFVAAVTLEYTFMPSNIYTLFDVTENKYFPENNYVSEIKRKMIKNCNEKEKIMVNRLKIIFFFFFINLSIPSLFISIINSITDKTQVKRFPFEGVYPFDSNSIVYYLPLYCFQCFYCLVATNNAFCIMCASTVAMYHLTNEIKLFCQSLSEIDALTKIHSNEFDEPHSNYNNFQGKFGSLFEKRLQVYLRHVVEHQLYIYR